MEKLRICSFVLKDTYIRSNFGSSKVSNYQTLERTKTFPISCPATLQELRGRWQTSSSKSQRASFPRRSRVFVNVSDSDGNSPRGPRRLGRSISREEKNVADEDHFQERGKKRRERLTCRKT